MFNVQRFISIYEKEGEDLIQEIELKMPLYEIAKIIKPDDDDSELHKNYSISKEQFTELSNLIPELKTFDFDKIEPSYECFTI